MTEARDPLRFARSEWDGLVFVRQPPPPGAPSFAATFVGPAGWGFDPAGAEGTARLTAQLLTSAIGPYDRVELARALDRAGATLSSQCAPESSEVTVWGPVDVWEQLLGLLAHAVLRPRFEADDFRRTARQLAERQLREATQPAGRAEREVLRTVFPRGHPYRNTGLGDARSLGRITRSKVRAFHQRHLGRAGSLLVITGAPSRARIERTARTLFRPVSDRTPPRLKVPSVSAARPETRRIDLPGRSQVEIRLGGASVARSSPAYPAAFLANEVLGGRPLLSRLFQTVRERAGLAYHASSDLEAMQFGGYWTAQAGTAPRGWPKVVALLDRELDQLRDEGPDRRELGLIRESAIGELPLSLESTADAHELAVEAAYHGLAEDHWRTWPEQLRRVRPADVREAASLALDRSRGATVVAGPIGRS